MTIRLATLDEIPALQQLVRLSVEQLSVGYYTPEQIRSSLQFMFGIDRQLILDQTYFVAEDDNEQEMISIAGCGGWSKRKTLFGGDQYKSTEDPLLDPSTDAARIRAFFIHPDFARRGIGRAIINACEQAAQQAGFMRTELVATLPGQPLYAACGYAPDEVAPDVPVALPDGVVLPCVKMYKNLA